MVESVATWHYIAAFFLFLVLGAIGHIGRAVFNVLPDRLSDKPMMDMMISDGYDVSDRLLGTEYDDNGYYRLDSLKNFRNYCLMTAFGGMVFMLFSDETARAVATMIQWMFGWFWQLILLRLSELGFM